MVNNGGEEDNQASNSIGSIRRGGIGGVVIVWHAKAESDDRWLEGKENAGISGVKRKENGD